MKLAEVLQIVDRQVVAGQVEERIKQHRAVAVDSTKGRGPAIAGWRL